MLAVTGSGLKYCERTFCGDNAIRTGHRHLEPLDYAAYLESTGRARLYLLGTEIHLLFGPCVISPGTKRLVQQQC